MKITLERHKVIWDEQFLKMKQKLLERLKGIDIRHIGSTSVKGLMAKPIIDILVGISNNIELNHTIRPIIEIGFEYVSKYENVLPNRRFFIFKHEKKVLYHIHLVKKESYWFKRHIAFRNELRSNKKTMLEYEALKILLSNKNWKNGNEYSDAKTEFIRSIENKIL